MSGFEYKVVPAPTHGLKAKGVRGTPARFANALQTVMNELGAAGWEYQRTDTLPVQERQGLTGKTTTFQNMLVFRRPINVEMPVAEAAAIPPALIEDHSDADSAAMAHAQPDAPPNLPANDAKIDKPLPTAVGDTLGHDAPVPISDVAQDAAENIKAPFVFPWNRRTQKPTADEAKSQPAAE